MPKSKHRKKNRHAQPIPKAPVPVSKQVAANPSVNALHPSVLQKQTRPFLPYATLLQHMKHAMAVPHTPLVREPEHNRKAIVVAGGPSLAETLPQLKELLKDPSHDVIAVNGSCDYLRDNGVAVRYHLIVDPQEKHARYVQRTSADIEYILSSQCHPSTIDAVAGRNITLWHVNNGYEYTALKASGERFCLMKAGSTAGLCSISVLWVKGYRAFKVFAMDGCVHPSGKSHIYENTLKEPGPVQVHDRTFMMTRWMVAQMYDFQTLMGLITYDDGRPLDMEFFGDGSVRHCYAAMENNRLLRLDQYLITEETDVDRTTGVPKRRTMVPSMQTLPAKKAIVDVSISENKPAENTGGA